MTDPTLRWPDRRGRFVERDSDRVSAVSGVEDVPLDVSPGDTVTVSDDDVAEHYRDRGFEPVDAGDADADADAGDGDDGGAEDGDAEDGSADGSDADFDAAGFVDRTPYGDVVADIRDGQADGHLDAVEAEASRANVIDAVESRQDEIGGE